jgi:3-oxoacyl-[acyl-carrier protein] reductase
MSWPAALVTGAGRGIGKAIALALASSGFHVAVNDRADGEELRRTLDEIRALGVKAAPAIGDVAAIERHAEMLDAAEEAVGPLTCLVNNAGVSVMSRGDLLDATPESYDRCQAVNARAVFFLTQAFARRLIGRPRDPDLHHSVIVISSANAVAASIARGEYCVSKAAASMAAKLFAVRLGAEDIGVYEIRPGLIETDMTVTVQDTYRRRIREGLTVAQRMGVPADIASVALAMATGRLAFCTGQAVEADGGLLIPRL